MSSELMNQPAQLAFTDIGVLSRTGWQPANDLTFDEWREIARTWSAVDSGINWWVGDWLNYGEMKYGEAYKEAMNLTGWEYQRLANAKYVSGKVEFSSREENLSWRHHAVVAPLAAAEQEKWLAVAEVEMLSKRELRKAIKAEQRAIEIPVLPSPVNLVCGDAREMVAQMPSGTKLLFSDPPYGMDWQSNRRTVKDKPDKIANDGDLNTALDLLDFVLGAAYDKLADDAFVCLWCDWKNYAAFKSAVEANRLSVRSVIVWNKPNHGTGDLEGAPAPKHEWIIFAVKGNPKLTGQRFDDGDDTL